MKISVCMIVKNEELQLGRALTSIPISCEVIIVDTGSTDRTIAIARETGARVYEYEWRHHFADARNFSVKQATGDYIFIMDADEQLFENWECAVNEHLARFPDQASAVMIHNITEGDLTVHHGVRLFPNNGKYVFRGNVHEQLYNEEELAQPIHSAIKLNHYGYSKEQYESKGKFERYVHLYREALIQDPNNGYMLYQLGKLYYSLNQFKEAYEPLSAAVMQQQFDRLYYPPLLVMFGYTLKELNNSNQAYELLLPLASKYPKFPDLYFQLGILAMETGRFNQIESHYKQALAIGDTDRYTTVCGCGSYRAAHNLGVFYEVSGRIKEACEYYKLAAVQQFQPSIQRLTEHLKKS
ncbi:tetratricopeptide repeat-containing glycosyltransferase family 2 protein [Cohnella mopanensis]|uniref:tetratricopeptide repeat-containing glycosyltransferase family 2 protein n=1 Tax=Cohnella mopanensis TaxID=2911966 RepID=UPI001EF8F18D|nr:glycosyltransferase family 2 protein [Cohnella mopanensis]